MSRIKKILLIIFKNELNFRNFEILSREIGMFVIFFSVFREFKGYSPNSSVGEIFFLVKSEVYY